MIWYKIIKREIRWKYKITYNEIRGLCKLRLCLSIKTKDQNFRIIIEKNKIRMETKQ